MRSLLNLHGTIRTYGKRVCSLTDKEFFKSVHKCLNSDIPKMKNTTELRTSTLWKIGANADDENYKSK